MNRSKHKEEAVPDVKSALSGQDDSQAKALRKARRKHKPDTDGSEPGPSSVSMKSDTSMDWPIRFKKGEPSVIQKIHQNTKGDPGSSSVSMKSDTSMDWPIRFKGGEPSVIQKIHQNTKDDPGSSSVSMKSDTSMDWPIRFKKGEPVTQKIHQNTKGDPGPSSVSMKSDTSMDWPIRFKKGEPVTQKIHQNTKGDPGPSSVSMKSDTSMDWPIRFKKGESSVTQKIHQNTKDDPGPSSVSMKSDTSMDWPIRFKGGESDVNQRTNQKSKDNPGPSGVSMKSDTSMDWPIRFNKGEPSVTQKIHQNTKDDPGPSSVSMKSDTSMDWPIRFQGKETDVNKSSKSPSQKSAEQYQPELKSIFKLLEDHIVSFVKDELNKMQKALTSDYPECSERQNEDEKLLPGENEEKKKSSREAFLNITLYFLRRMNQDELADRLQSKSGVAALSCQKKVKSNLKRRFQFVFEGITKAGNPTLLKQMFTELHVTEGGTAETNDEHEVTQIETASRQPDKQEITIRREDILKGPPGREEPITTVMTKGVAGIGKTVLTQKFTLDWAEGKANQDIHFMFPFTFRELNVVRDRRFSLVELVHYFFTETKEEGICRFEEFQVVFIFDGLDECRLPLDFTNNQILTDATESTSVDVLLTNLIRGKLLPSARLWITTRPAAANQIPPECVDMVTEVRGFTDPQKEEYFRKRFRDEEQANTVVSHIKTSRSLHVMCHIPVFCWITATVLEEMLKSTKRTELPKTLTQMYIHFLVVQAKLKNVKYDGRAEADSHWSPESKKMIESLGKLAFEQLQKRNLIFYESDLEDCGMNIKAASVYSGVFTQVFKEESGLYQDKVFCFVHLSIMEFLAALHVHLTFINSGVSLLAGEQIKSRMQKVFKDKPKLHHLYQNAVNTALMSPNGHLDLFLRFLLGLSLQNNQNLLRGLLTKTEKVADTNQKITKYIKKKISEDLSPERSINLFHCLNELNDLSLVEEIQQYLKPGLLSTNKLSPAQWSALVFILLSSGKDLDVFDLKNYSASEEALLRLLPVVKASNKALLSGCNLSERSCKEISSALSSQSSSLTELELTNNDLQDSGVKLLLTGLNSPHCTLEILRLGVCQLSWKSCKYLSSVLTSNPFTLRELDLSNNDLLDSGMNQLSIGLKSSNCNLEILRLSGCQITAKGCDSLVSALKSKAFHLKELDLAYNHPGDSREQLFSDGDWRPKILRLEPAGEQWLKSGLKKYACNLTLDINTVNRKLKLSDNNRKVALVGEKQQSYPDHKDRFDCCQVLCRDDLAGRCYWEVVWVGEVDISVTYRGIARKGNSDSCRFGGNNQSWSLKCSNQGYSAFHDNIRTSIASPVSDRVAVYLDHPGGTLSFYRVSTDTLIHLHTFNTTFTETLHPGFGFGIGSGVESLMLSMESSVSLCSL